MTSNINFSSIDETYPIAGKDNNSQGFRDNFGIIKSGLATAKSEITELQTKSLLNQNLITTDPVINDLQGSSITNGFLNNMHSNAHTATVTGTTTIDVSAAELHVFSLASNTSFTFTNWPASGYYAKVKVHFTSNGSGDYIPSLYSSGGGVIHLDNLYPSPLTATAAGKHFIIEAWSYNHGATVFVKYLGDF